MKKKPRVLIINEQSMFRNNATGITLRSIFGLMPAEDVLELFWYADREPVENKLGIKSMQIPGTYMPLNYALRRVMGYENKYATAKGGASNFGSQIHLSRGQVIKHKIKATVENSFLLPSGKWLAQIDAFAPTVVYTLSGSFYVNKWSMFFAKRYGCPVVVHYMDDWRPVLYTQDKRLEPLNRRLNRQLEKLEKRMKTGLVISEAMAQAYCERYGNCYMAVMNTVADMQLPEPVGEGLHIVYAGGLHLNRYQSLLQVADAIRQMPGARLSVYTSEDNAQKYAHLFTQENVVFHKPVPNELIGKVYAEADVLLHIESFDPQVVNYTKYSLSTKIAEYMMSSRAILLYAPESIAVYQYLHSNHCGVCVAEKTGLPASLEMLKDPAVRKQLGQTGRSLAEKNHSQEHLKQVLRKVFDDNE